MDVLFASLMVVMHSDSLNSETEIHSHSMILKKECGKIKINNKKISKLKRVTISVKISSTTCSNVVSRYLVYCPYYIVYTVY